MSLTRSLITSLFPFLLRPFFTTNTNFDAVYGPPTEFDAFWEEYLRQESVWWKRIWSRASDFDDVNVDAFSPTIRVWTSKETSKDTRPIFAPTSLARKYPAAMFFGYDAPTVTVAQYFAPTATHSQPRAAPSRPSRPQWRRPQTYDWPSVSAPRLSARLPAVDIGSFLLGVLFTCILLLVLEIPCRCREIGIPELSRQAEVDQAAPVAVPAIEDVPVLKYEVSDAIKPSNPVVAFSPCSVKADDVAARTREEPASTVVNSPPQSFNHVRSATEPAPAPSKTPFTTQILQNVSAELSAFDVPDFPPLPLSTTPFEPLQPYALITAPAGSVYPPPPSIPMSLPSEPDFFYKSWGTAAPKPEPLRLSRPAPEPELFYETGPRPTIPLYLKDTANMPQYQVRRTSTTHCATLSGPLHLASSQRPLPPSHAFGSEFHVGAAVQESRCSANY